MMNIKFILTIVALCALLASCSAPQSSKEKPQSESSGSGNVLPHPEAPFTGKIGETVAESEMKYPAPLKAPKDAPNVLLVLLDDVGYGMSSTFGGIAQTPTLDKLASNGLRYNRMHTTALCSPTRGALLTGRNHHSIGTGVIIEMGTGFPGYTGIIPNTTVGLPEMLRQNGYATAAFGKWHNTPANEISPSGPFDRWPTGSTIGFEYFYGFMNGETHQYYPVLYRNTTPVPPPSTPEKGYHFTEDMTDETIDYLNRINATNPDKPWFVYFSTGGIHAPHHTPKHYREKYKGRFDMGWDKYREETLERQKKLGVVPANTRLTTRPSSIAAWDDQSAEKKKVYGRLMENYAGFLEHTDVQVGRVIEALEKSGELENTLVIYIVGDNGASAEGGLEGTVNEIASLNGIQLGIQGLLKNFEKIGGPETEPHVPVAWAWAACAPFQWTKQMASHFGGTRNAMVMSWPKKITDKGGLRSQFHHVIDIAPTVLEAAGLPQPTSVNGVKQRPIEGVSMLYSFADANAPSTRTTQYFEMMGGRAIYKDGWVACTSHDRIPWETAAAGHPFTGDRWELYHIDEDFSEANDLAASNQDKLKELQAAFTEEAKKYQVFPLDDRMAQRFDGRLRPNPLAGLKSFTYGPGSNNINESMVLNTHGVPFTITAKVQADGKANGVLAAIGGVSSGWTLYVKNGKPVFDYNFFEESHYNIASPTALPAGASTVRMEFVPDEPGPGKPATVTLFVNNKQVAKGRVERTVPMAYSVEGFDVGMDNVSPVSRAYSSPYAFTGKIESVTVEVK